MKGVRNDRIPRLPGFALWSGLSVLFALGCLTTVIDLTGLSARENARASQAKQHFLIDPVSGEVSMGSAPAAKDESFDVGKKEDAPTEAKEGEPAADTKEPEAATPETKAQEAAKEGDTAAPADEHAAETKPESAEAPKAEIPADHAAATAPAAEPAPAAAAVASSSMPALRTTPAEVAIGTPAHSKDSLVSAPAREVTETVGTLQLPKRGEKDVTPASLYAHPFKRKPEQILISFVVTDIGLEPQSIGSILSLPGEVSAAYSAYSKKETAYSESVRAAGHEVWTMLPVMTDRYPSDDPGPLGLVSQMPQEEITRRLQEILAVIPGSIGVVLPANEALSTQKGALEPVLQQIHDRGLLMLTTNTTRMLSQMTSNKELKAIMHRADMVLDPEPNEAQIKAKLDGLLAAAKEKGQYLVVVSSRPQSLQLLGEWLKANPLKEPYALAPISALFVPTAAEKEEAAKEAPPAEGEKKEAESGHGGAEKKEEKKKKPKEKPKKPLPQDKYKQAPAEGGGHGGGEKKEEGGHH